MSDLYTSVYLHRLSTFELFNILYFYLYVNIRVLYSCQVKLFSWVPGMVVKFLTKTALLEATQWVKKETEAARSKESKLNKSWFSARATVSPCEENRINSEFGRGVCSERDKIHVIFRFGSLASFKGRIYRI